MSDGARVQQVDVGGIPGYVAEAPGDTFVGLAFGVGEADEPLPIRGVAHLCEHLVLSDLGRQAYAYNGWVGWIDTQFVAEGTADQMAAFLNGVGVRLARLPVERLPKELAILRAEQASSGLGVVERLLVARFGACSYGRAGLAQYGLFHLDAEMTRSWAQEHFHAGIAAVWVVGPDPISVVERLDLGIPRGVPGTRRELKPVSPLPRAIIENVAGPHVSFVVRRSVAMRAAFATLEEELNDEMRHDRALTYGVDASYDALGGHMAHVYFGIGTLPESRGELTRALYEAFARFAERGPQPAAIERYIDWLKSSLQEPTYAIGDVIEHVLGHVSGDDPLPDHAFYAQLDALTPESIAEAFSESLTSGLALVPSGTRPNRMFPFTASSASSGAVQGVTHRRARGHNRSERLIVAKDGVTWTAPPSTPVTILADDCQLVMAWDDGQRYLIGSDGAELLIQPSTWRDGGRLIATIDQTMPVATRVPAGPGDGPMSNRNPR